MSCRRMAKQRHGKSPLEASDSYNSYPLVRNFVSYRLLSYFLQHSHRSFCYIFSCRRGNENRVYGAVSPTGDCVEVLRYLSLKLFLLARWQVLRTSNVVVALYCCHWVEFKKHTFTINATDATVPYLTINRIASIVEI